MKTIQLSTRVTQDDAEFLASLKVEGAITPSDKVRALIADAREKTEGLGSYSGSLRQVRGFIGPVVERILELESGGFRHSELVTPTLEWLAETMAFVLAYAPSPGLEGDAARGAARELEAGLADRVFRLFTAVLRLGVTLEASSYDEDVIQARLSPVLELSQIIASNRARCTVP